MSHSLTVRDLAAVLRGTVIGDPERIVSNVSTPGEAGDGDLIFIAPGTHAGELRQSRAAAALLPPGIDPPPQMSAIRVGDPRAAMDQAVALIRPSARRLTGISPQAHIGTDVRLGKGVGLGPFVCVGDGVSIGPETEIHPGSTIGERSTIGESCVIYAGVHIYHDVAIGNRVIVHSGAVIGADGFGYQRGGNRRTDDQGDPHSYHKVPQVGRVVIDDDVEIGANTTIDRATLGATRVGRGTKIDNLVMVGHNSTVGRNGIIIGQAGLSGSTFVGDNVTIAGQAGLAGHLSVGDGAVIGAQAGVTKAVPPGATVLGSPAEDARLAKRALPLIVRLPEIRRALKDHEARLSRLEGRTGTGDE